MILKANTLAIGFNLQTSFQASGGTPPYVYSVVPAGAGGSIDPSTGVYTSSANINKSGQYDTVVATDSLAATAQLRILNANALMLVCDIIQKFMGLTQNQVYLYNQKIMIPTDERLYIAVGVLSCKPFANNTKYDSLVPGLTEVQSTNFLANLSIDILSRDLSALNRKEEVIMALQSSYAEQQQELNSFYIANVSNGFNNLSQDDGAAIPNRFNISANIQYFVSKSTPVDFFDDFDDPAFTVVTEP